MRVLSNKGILNINAEASWEYFDDDKSVEKKNLWKIIDKILPVWGIKLAQFYITYKTLILSIIDHLDKYWKTTKSVSILDLIFTKRQWSTNVVLEGKGNCRIYNREGKEPWGQDRHALWALGENVFFLMQRKCVIQ